MRDKVRPAWGLHRLTRDKIRPAQPLLQCFREKTRPARHKPPILGHFSCTGRTISRIRPPPDQAGRTLYRTRGRCRYKTLPAHTPSEPNRYKTLPAHWPGGPNRYKTLPARPKTPKSGHFSRAGRIFSRFHHHATEQGELFPASNTTLVPISTQLTGWSPLSPGHQTNAPLSWALCGLSAAHHDVAPERAGTDRRLADWNWPRHTQASSEQLNPEQARLA